MAYYQQQADKLPDETRPHYYSTTPSTGPSTFQILAIIFGVLCGLFLIIGGIFAMKLMNKGVDQNAAIHGVLGVFGKGIDAANRK